jgi:hypothetical protein
MNVMTAAIATLFATRSIAAHQPAITPPRGDDPIFAAIETHRSLNAAWQKMNLEKGRLQSAEEALLYRRHANPGRHDPHAIVDLRNRLYAAEQRSRELSDARKAAEWALLEIAPTTHLGCAALADYAARHLGPVSENGGWAAREAESSGRLVCERFEVLLLKHLSKSLIAIGRRKAEQDAAIPAHAAHAEEPGQVAEHQTPAA